MLYAARLALHMGFGEKQHHPDQCWQGAEVAYYLAYSDELSVAFTWEWDADYALRAIVYPLFLSLPLHVLRLLRIDTNFLVVNSVGAMNTVIQVAGDYHLYLLTERLAGKRAARIALAFSLVNFRTTDIFAKTLTNGAEAACSVIAFYYFTLLEPKCDRSMKLMTLFISLAFLVRSSSLVGWIPLALIKAFTSADFFLAIVQAAFTVALPVLVLSTLADSWFYGKLTVPPYNFLYINVVENLSRYFGEEAGNFYIFELRNTMISSRRDIGQLTLLGFCFLTAYQFNGLLRVQRNSTFSRAPYLLLFAASNLLVLSGVGHKEPRFMAQLIPFFGLSFAFFWEPIFHWT